MPTEVLEGFKRKPEWDIRGSAYHPTRKLALGQVVKVEPWDGGLGVVVGFDADNDPIVAPVFSVLRDTASAQFEREVEALSCSE